MGLKHYNEAIKWYKLSAKQGYSDSQFKLGNIYFDGQIIPQNYHKSFKWFIKASNQNHSKSQQMISQMYKEGLGVEKNEIESKNWFSKSLKNEDILGLYLLIFGIEIFLFFFFN